MQKTNKCLKLNIKEVPLRKLGKARIRVLNSFDASAKKLTMTHVFLPAGEKLPFFKHNKTDEWIYIIEGSVNVTLNKQELCLKAGDCLYLRRKTWHSFLAGERGVKAISLYYPPINWKQQDVEIEYRVGE